MNMAVDDSRLGDDEYSFAMNVRNRFGELTPVKRPLIIDTGFTANQRFQGIYTVGDFILLFQSGHAKFKHRLSDTWVTLWDASTNSTLQMSANADFMYVQAVPGSTMNMERKSESATKADDPINLTYNSTAWVKTSAGIVVQDGENTPNLIIFSSSNQTAAISVRKCKSYTEWDATTREYVPIGKQMMFFGGKLYVIGADADGNFTQIYHSVTGRPLDFVVAINNSGAQIDAAEANGGAGVVSYSVSYEAVTCMRPLNTDSFFISTRTSSYAVTPDYTRTVFGEPLFTKKYLFGASVVNQFSFVDVLGDFAFIDTEGLRSFNAVQQLRNEGRNSAFSLKVAKLLDDKSQSLTASAAITFDNYAFFAVQTIYGHGVLVFDSTLKKFVSFDNFTKDDDTTCAPIVQFTKIDSADAHELYAITSYGEMIKMWGGIKYSAAYVQTKAFNVGDSRVDQKPLTLRTLFTDVKPIESIAIQVPYPDVLVISWDGITSLSGTPDPPYGIWATPPTTFTSTSAFALPVKPIPYTLAIGTVIRFYGWSHALTGYGIPNSLAAGDGGADGMDGTFELTVAASVGDVTLTGKLTTASYVYWNSPAYVKYDGSGTVSCTPISNGVAGQSVLSKTLVAPTFDGMRYTAAYPLMWDGQNKIQSLAFNFQDSRIGWKASYAIKWDNAATLSIINIETKDITSKNSLMTQAYAS
jgi:hypothetical protein